MNASKKRVLIVDDNVDTAELLRFFLEQHGYDVDAAHDGESTLEHARQFNPDVILLDISLPGMDGFSVVSALRESDATKRIRTIAMTGYGSPDDVRRCLDEGFDEHITKPVDLDALLERIHAT